MRVGKQISVFLMNCLNRRRLKILGTVEWIEIEDDLYLIAKIHQPEYRAVAECPFLITLVGFDWKRQQHIPQCYKLGELSELEIE